MLSPSLRTTVDEEFISTYRTQLIEVDLLDRESTIGNDELQGIKEHTIDIIFSIGVRMHTGDAHKAAASLATKLKGGGSLSLRLYGQGNFITYPEVNGWFKEFGLDIAESREKANTPHNQLSKTVHSLIGRPSTVTIRGVKS